MRHLLFLSVASMLLLTACKKKSDCATFVKLTATTTTPSVGSPFEITASDDGADAIYTWSHGNSNNSTNTNKVSSSSALMSDRGWYYVTKTNPGCNNVLHDSIYIDVKLMQETPPCTLTNNYISCSNIPSVTLTSITEAFDPTWNAKAVYGSGTFGYPSFTVLFNSYNGNTEPLDGTYMTTNSPTFDVTQEYNVVSISFLYASNYFHCHPDQKLYVTHVNGKIQISFCNMVFASPPYLTTCSGKMTKQ